MRFWDASAVVPLLVREPASGALRRLVDEDPELVVWWGTPVECASGLARLRREGVIDAGEETRVLLALAELRESWIEVQPTLPLRATAQRLLRTHALRAADAHQLAAALVWAGRPRGDVLVTLDERLAEAARLEGFTVSPVS